MEKYINVFLRLFQIQNSWKSDIFLEWPHRKNFDILWLFFLIILFFSFVKSVFSY